MTHVFALGDLLGHPGCGRSPTTASAAIRERFEDREHGGWFPEDLCRRPGRPEGGLPHAFVLLAAAARAIAGPPAGERAADEAAIAVVEAPFWSEDEGAMPGVLGRRWSETEAYRGANANMHMVEAFLAAGDATGDGVWYERALQSPSG